MLIFDLETDGLLDDVTTIHCLHLFDTDRPELGVQRYNNHNYNAVSTVADGVETLGNADELLAHNGIGFDYLVLDKLYPDWNLTKKPKRLDSIVMSAVIFTELKRDDFAARNRGYWVNGKTTSVVPEKVGGIIGSHSLKAWGLRLGNHKEDYDPRSECETGLTVSQAWKTVGWTERMDDYCVQDVIVTVELYKVLAAKRCSESCLDLEHQFKTIIDRQERFGFKVDVAKAARLHQALLLRRTDLEAEIQAMIPTWYEPDGRSNIKPTYSCIEGTDEYVCTNEEQLAKGYRCPKVKNKVRFETKGAPYTKTSCKTFNAGSTDQIANRLQVLYGWEPEVLTPDGLPSCTDEILSTLSYPCVPAIREYLIVSKRLGQLAAGSQGILRKIRDDGRIHGRVQTNGAGTGRCTHSGPNVAQTPAVGSPYGAEFRELYTVQKGWKLVGADAAGIELRVMGHYLAAYDEGRYAQEVVSGDAHWVNLQAIGITNDARDHSSKVHSAARACGKTWVYSYLYGCGVDLSGVHYREAYLAYHRKEPAGTLLGNGRKSRKALKKNLPALASLEKAVKKAATDRGRLKGLDGRYVNIRSVHSALNALFQSAGAVIMKKSLCILDDRLQELGMTPSADYEFVANVHDEWQVEVRDADGMPQIVADESCKAMTSAGEFFKLKVLIEGEAHIGNNWAETH